MSHKFLLNSSFHENLRAIDFDLAEDVRTKGCPYCGNSLHQSNYSRSPIGMPLNLRIYYELRFSFCCSECRKRVTSPSVRFFGRRWYVAPLHTLVTALSHSSVGKCCKQFQKLFGINISVRTAKRWKQWWLYSFTQTNFWRSVVGMISINFLNDSFPRCLFSFPSISSSGDPPKAGAQMTSENTSFTSRLIWVLRFLAPITAGVLRAV